MTSTVWHDNRFLLLLLLDSVNEQASKDEVTCAGMQ